MNKLKQTVFPIEYKQIPVALRQQVLKRDNYTCTRCGANGEKREIETHHIIPVRKGGTHSLDNVITLCLKCHLEIEPRDKKHDSDYAIKPSDMTNRKSFISSPGTRDRLKKHGLKGETYEAIIIKLLDHWEKTKK